MNYDDETLMAYADGELDEATRVGIYRAIEQDPELARRVEQHRALRTQVAGAFAPVAGEPVPDRLLAAAKGAAPRGKVVNFPAHAARQPASPWRAREWTAMAASLVVGGLIAWRFMSGAVGNIATVDGALVARGTLAKALESQLASSQAPEGAVHIGITFKAGDGAFCRTFVARASSSAGLACRGSGGWRIDMLSGVSLDAGHMRPAAASLPPALLREIEMRMGGEPLDAAGEQAARDAGWQ